MARAILTAASEAKDNPVWYNRDMQSRRPDVEFSAVLRPHRSLSRRGFLILMAAVGGVSFAAGIFFISLGAWPVFGFLGLDAAIIYWAFRRNFRAAEAREIVEVTPHEVVVHRLVPGRPAQEARFPRAWVRVELDEDGGNHIVGSLGLLYRGRRTEIGGFLPPAERKSLAAALKAAVARPRI